jgi:hypothetical protein
MESDGGRLCVQVFFLHLLNEEPESTGVALAHFKGFLGPLWLHRAGLTLQKKITGISFVIILIFCLASTFLKKDQKMLICRDPDDGL